jgi:hypothetical protein
VLVQASSPFANLERLEGVSEIAKAAGVTSWRKANVSSSK